MSTERNVNVNQSLVKYPNEGTDASGSLVTISRSEAPTRIDKVSDTLYYFGWAKLDTLETEPLWKIRRSQQVGNVWEEKFVEGNETYNYVWNDRASYSYS